MDNQHRLIKGYRELSQSEIGLINDIKGEASATGDLVNSLSSDESFDQRWVNIGRTHLQQGFMALTRAVAKPDSF